MNKTELIEHIASKSDISKAAATRALASIIEAVKKTLKKGDTVQSLAAKMAYTDAPLDRFRVLNGLAASVTTLPVGQKVKIVTY